MPEINNREANNPTHQLGGEKVPAKGAQFMDTRFSPVKFITTDDDRGFKEGDVLYIGSSDGTKVYGPYQLDLNIGAGGGKVHWKAFAVGANRNSIKPPTKDELVQQNAQLLARLAALEARAQE